MIIGHILGIPIPLIAVYFCVVRPLTMLLSRVDSAPDPDPKSTVEKVASAIKKVFFTLFILALLVVVMIAVAIVTLT